MPTSAIILSFENLPLSCICSEFRCWLEVHFDKPVQTFIQQCKIHKLLQVSTFMTHIRRYHFFFWDQNTNGLIPSRIEHKYEGICNTPLTKLALLSSVFLILGTEIKDTVINYTEYYYFPNENGQNRLKFPHNFCFQHMLNTIVHFA